REARRRLRRPGRLYGFPLRPERGGRHGGRRAGAARVGGRHRKTDHHHGLERPDDRGSVRRPGGGDERPPEPARPGNLVALLELRRHARRAPVSHRRPPGPPASRAVRPAATGDEGDVLRLRRGLHVGEHGGAVVAPSKTIWLCPGQGAQKVGMAKDLAERFPAARQSLDAIDERLAFRLSRLMFEGPEEELTATHNAQPATLAASAAGYAVVGAANRNAPDQTVISGDPPAVAAAGEGCRVRGAKRVIPLKVSGAFHSSLMAPAANHLRVALERAPFRNPAFPVIANATAEPVREAGRARRLLADQLTAPVRWVACMQRAAELAGAGARFVEIGPGTVLAGLVKRSVPGATTVSLGTADEVARFLEGS